jgi:hypothetical protein
VCLVDERVSQASVDLESGAGLPWANALLAGAVALIVFLYTIGYRGVVHDAQLYAFQALARLHPEELAGDLFLRYGSQDRYSLFSLAYTPLIPLLGVSGAALTLMLVSLLLLFAATWVLLASSCGATAALAATLAVAVWPVPYGGEFVFRVGEPFATPRPLACAIALLSVATLTRGRIGWALVLVVCALVIHPLMTLPVILVMIVGFIRLSRAVTLVLILSAAISVGTWIGVPVLEQLMHPMDSEWRETVLQRSPFLSPLHWSPGDWSLAGVALLSPLLVALRVGGALRRLYVAAGMVGALGVAVTVIGSDLAGSALVMQIQPWRALWLSHWLGVAGIGLLLVQHDAQRKQADLAALLGLIGAELSAANTGVAVIAVSLWGTWVLGRATQDRISRLAFGAVLVMAGQAVLWYIAGLGSTLAFAAMEMSGGSIVPPVMRNPGLVGGVLAAGFLARNFLLRPARRVILGSTFTAILMVGAVNVQRAVSADLGQMRSVANPALIVRVLPQGGSVLWGETGWMAWFVLQYPSYISNMQTAGLVFSREAAMEASRRARHVEAVLGEQMMMRWRVNEMPSKPIDASAVVSLCADPMLSAVYVPGTTAMPVSLPVHNERGVQTGSLALCRGARP